jgi:hypothetical protein
MRFIFTHHRLPKSSMLLMAWNFFLRSQLAQNFPMMSSVSERREV